MLNYGQNHCEPSELTMQYTSGTNTNTAGASVIWNYNSVGTMKTFILAASRYYYSVTCKTL